jgi:adenylate cyclase
MFTDMVGYTALGQRNESLSLALVEEQRKLIRPILVRHNGREVKTIGDAFLVEFPNASDSVRCAYDIQRAIREFNLSLASDKRIHLRVGIHLGEVIESQGDISGDAVNVASRIEPLAEDGGVCLTRQVYDQVSNKTELRMASIGVKPLKNVSVPTEVYKMEMPWDQPTTSQVASYPTNRVAILPFTSFSSNPDDAYFADGMTEEIISTVSGISGLDVISRTSVMGYKGTTKKVEEIGRELKVGSVLEGSFRKAGNRIRVTTQLIEVARDKHLWAQNYDRNLDDIFEVQSDVAKQVADALRIRILSPEMERIERKPTESTTAYTLYLKGRYYWNKRGVENVKKASEYFELAVHEDPSFALGYVGQADCCLVLENWGFDMKTNQEKAKTMATRALELDPVLAEAHSSMGSVMIGEHKCKQAEMEFRMAVELKPGYATAHQWYSNLLLSELKWDEALKQVEKAVELDPLSPVVNYNHGLWYYARREYGRALELYKKVVELDPTYIPVRIQIVWTYGRLKMYDDMQRAVHAAVEVGGATYPFLRMYAEFLVAFCRDDRKALKGILPELEAHLEEPGGSAGTFAPAYFLLGEIDSGFEWLEKEIGRAHV